LTPEEGAALMRRLLNKEGLRRPIKRLSWIWQYEQYGPLIGPKESHQSDFDRYDRPPLPETRRWPGDEP
jgi:hypothetical protein